MTDAPAWRRCSACKKPIAFGTNYWICNVSTCNRKRTGLAFCSVSCWEVHLPTANHREAWALERVAPPAGVGDDPSPVASPPTGRRRIVPVPSPRAPGSRAPAEILIVASRLKDYVRARSGFNTSDGVLEPLSDVVRRLCDEAIRNATREGRRTVLERDIPAE
jgi:hypothetical protein